MTGLSSILGEHGWWLASRASGLLALLLVTISVALGLTMSSKLSSRPGLKKRLIGIHEQTALAGLIAIVIHGATLLGDAWLNPGLSGIAVPFSMSYRPLFTGLGIIGGYLAAILGLSFYVRRWIGPKLWRKAHRLTIVVYVLAVIHVIGAGTDASTVWLRAWLFVSVPVIAALFLARLYSARGAAARRAKSGPRRSRSTAEAVV
jgi:methionine sulfoxide reductase heme-binding subunit